MFFPDLSPGVLPGSDFNFDASFRNAIHRPLRRTLVLW